MTSLWALFGQILARSTTPNSHWGIHLCYQVLPPLKLIGSQEAPVEATALSVRFVSRAGKRSVGIFLGVSGRPTQAHRESSASSRGPSSSITVSPSFVSHHHHHLSSSSSSTAITTTTLTAMSSRHTRAAAVAPPRDHGPATDHAPKTDIL